MRKQIAQVRCPAGFSFSINSSDKSNVVIALLDKNRKNRKVGHVRLDLDDESGMYETHSYLETRYHNRGLGAKLYARAIQWALRNGCKVKSSGTSSCMARRVWNGKTIRKYFRIVRRPYKRNPSPIWDTWYAYAK